MNKNIIEQKYPKAYQLMRNWIIDIVKKQGIKEEILAKFPIDVTISGILSINVRQLYDFFDKYEILMIINLDNNKWRFIICETHIILDQTNYNSRIEAEQLAFEKCFELLEKKLS